MGPPGLVAVGAAGVVVTGTGAAIVTGVRTLAPVARVAAVGLLPFTVMHSDDWEGTCTLARIWYARSRRAHLLAAAATEATEETINLWRGVNENHARFTQQSAGVVTPNRQWWEVWKRSATAFEHNTVPGATLNSPYTSWTTNQDVAGE